MVWSGGGRGVKVMQIVALDTVQTGFGKDKDERNATAKVCCVRLGGCCVDLHVDIDSVLKILLIIITRNILKGFVV